MLAIMGRTGALFAAVIPAQIARLVTTAQPPLEVAQPALMVKEPHPTMPLQLALPAVLAATYAHLKPFAAAASLDTEALQLIQVHAPHAVWGPTLQMTGQRVSVSTAV